MTFRFAVLTALATAALAACQTAPSPDSGFLLTYDGLERREDTLRASIRERRDETLAAAVDRIRLSPAVIVGDAGAGLTPDEIALVLREVDRQVCYELSERFTLAPDDATAASVRVGVTGVRPTGRAASGVSAVANAFIPGPGNIRVPGTTGGLAVETELLTADGRQAAALAWARDANVVGMDTPSLSRVGDALQLAEPFGDAAGDVFAPKDRPVRDIPTPDPCLAFGPRVQPGGFLTRVVTGLYVPEVNTGSAPAEADRP